MIAANETRLLLVRHGEAVVAVDRVVGGPETCSGLSELGRRQVEALRDRFASGSEPAVDALYASTLPRAIETADGLRPVLGDLPVSTVRDLEELRPGQADGIAFAHFAAHFGEPNGHGRPDRPIAPDGESDLEFMFRTQQAIERIVAAHVGRTVLISCHGGVIEVAFRCLLDLPRHGHFNLWTLNTSITELSVEDDGPQRGRWRLIRYNDAAHLNGLPAATPWR